MTAAITRRPAAAAGARGLQRVEHGADAGRGLGAGAAGREHVAAGRRPGQREDHDARRRRGLGEPRDERDAELRGDEPHHRLPVARPVGDLRREARRPGSRREAPRRTTSRPAARPSSRPASAVEVDPGAARPAGGRAASTASSMSPSSSSRWKRASPRPRRGRALHAEDHVVRRARSSERHGLGRLRLQDAQLEPRRRRRAGGGRPGRAGPRARSGSRRRAPRRAARRPARPGRPPAARAGRTARRRAPSSTCAAGVSRTLRPAGSSSAVPDLALQRRELLGDGGRREVQRVGRRGERAVVGDARAGCAGAGGRP